MSLAYYMDEHIPRAITEGLRIRGVDVLTVQEDGRSGGDDPEMLDRAGQLGRVLFSQDDDLLAEGHRRQKLGLPFAGVIYSHQRSLTLGACIRELEWIAGSAEPEELQGVVLFLPL